MAHLDGNRGFSAANVSQLDTGNISISGSGKYIKLLAFAGAGTPANVNGVAIDPAGANEALSSLDAAQTWNTNFRASTWAKVGPADASAKPVRVTWASNQDETMALVDVYTGIDQTTTRRTPTSPATGGPTVDATATLNVTSVAGDTVLGHAAFGVGASSNATLSSATITIRQKVEGPDIGGFEACAQGDTTAAGSSTTVSVASSTSGIAIDWAMFGESLIPAAAGTTVTPGAGSMTLSGLVPTVISPLTALPGAGALTFAGQIPTVVPHFGGQLFTVGWTADDFSEVGGAAKVGGFAPDTANATVTPDAAALSLVGLVPTIDVTGGGASVSPGAGTLTLTGLAPTVFRQDAVSPGAGSLVFTGLAPAALMGTLATPGAGSMTINGLAPSLLQDSIRTPGAGSLTLAGLAPTIVQDYLRAPGAGSLVFAGLAPTVAVTANQVALPGVGSLTLSGLAPTVSATADQVAQPDAGAMVITGLAPTAATSDNRVAAPGAGSMVITGLAPAIQNGGSLTVQPDAGALTMAGLVPAVQQTANQAVSPGAGAMTMAGAAPALDLAITVPAGSAAFTGRAPAAVTTANQTVEPGSGEMTLAGYAPVVTSPLEISVPAGELTFQGYAPRATNSGDRHAVSIARNPKLIAKRKKKPNIRIEWVDPEKERQEHIREVDAARDKQIAEAQVAPHEAPAGKPRARASGLLLRLMKRLEPPAPSTPAVATPPPKSAQVTPSKGSAAAPPPPAPKPKAPPPPEPEQAIVEPAKPALPPEIQAAVDAVAQQVASQVSQQVAAIRAELERERGLRASAEETLRAKRERDRRLRNQRVAAELAARMLIE